MAIPVPQAFPGQTGVEKNAAAPLRMSETDVAVTAGAPLASSVSTVTFPEQAPVPTWPGTVANPSFAGAARIKARTMVISAALPHGPRPVLLPPCWAGDNWAPAQSKAQGRTKRHAGAAGRAGRWPPRT